MKGDLIWTLVGLFAAAFTSTSFIPQLLARLRNPSQARLSDGMLVAFMVGASLWTLYGVHLHDAIIIVANLVAVSTLAAIAIVQSYQERTLKAKEPESV
jgi:MtN3 and saliva related transmembrane protein